jgi:hypothetical protein
MLGKDASEVETQHNYIYHMIREVRELNGLKLDDKYKIVLFCLESRGLNAFPSRETLADDCGFSESKLNKVLKILKEYEIVDWDQIPFSSNRYKINRQLIAYTFYQEMSDKELSKQQAIANFRPEWDIPVGNIEEI